MAISLLENELCRFPPIGVTQGPANTTIRKVFFDYFATGNDILVLKEKLLGKAVDNAGTLVRYLPWHDPDQPTQYVIRVDHQGYGYGGNRVASSVPDTPMTTGMEVQKWVLTIYFSTLPYPVGAGYLDASNPPYVNGTAPPGSPPDETQRFCTKDPRPGREYINPPKGQFWLGTQTTPMSIPVPTILCFAELDTTWFWVPLASYPKTAVNACLGKVNKTTLLLPSIPDGVTSYAPETVHLLAVRPEIVYFPDGSKGAHIMYGLRWRGGDGNQTWNTYPDETGAFLRLHRGAANSGQGLFDTAEFNNLFRTEGTYVP